MGKCTKKQGRRAESEPSAGGRGEEVPGPSRAPLVSGREKRRDLVIPSNNKGQGQRSDGLVIVVVVVVRRTGKKTFEGLEGSMGISQEMAMGGWKKGEREGREGEREGGEREGGRGEDGKKMK